jgi:hypothetical protein
MGHIYETVASFACCSSNFHRISKQHLHLQCVLFTKLLCRTPKVPPACQVPGLPSVNLICRPSIIGGYLHNVVSLNIFIATMAGEYSITASTQLWEIHQAARIVGCLLQAGNILLEDTRGHVLSRAKLCIGTMATSDAPLSFPLFYHVSTHLSGVRLPSTEQK